MNDLHKALGDITSIRREMARTTQFRGYGPATLAATGAFALIAAATQSIRLQDPAGHLRAYLGIWCITAILSAALVGAQMFTRSRRIHSSLSDEMIRMAVEQFLPSVAAGILLTIVIARYVPTVAWMLPGLWQIVFSIGVCSSCRFLPRPMLAAGAWYLFTGLLSIAIGSNRALSPWTMGLSFGIGQQLVAIVLLITNTESDDEI